MITGKESQSIDDAWMQSWVRAGEAQRMQCRQPELSISGASQAMKLQSARAQPQRVKGMLALHCWKVRPSHIRTMGRQDAIVLGRLG